jgi:hypothetical protein
MLFVILATGKPGTMKERLERRMGWSYPQGYEPIAEYWLQGTDPAGPELVAILETDNLAGILASIAAWDDVFSFKVFPAVTAEQGLEICKKMHVPRPTPY